MTATARLLLAALLALSLLSCSPEPRPALSILFVTTDDQSWLDAGAYGSPVRTPALDQLAERGVRFTHAFAATPSCTSSRNAILTSLPIGRLGDGATLFGTAPAELAMFTDVLAAAGYAVGFTGKAWGPGKWQAGGRATHPAGQEFNDAWLPRRPKGIARFDYAENFERFLAKTGNQPFFFWVGIREPHRGFGLGSGEQAGLRPEDVRVPGFLPDRPEVRTDLLDYLAEIEHADRHLGRMLDRLRESGRLAETVVVVTSDNGMPFPRSKANLYDSGTRVPLVIALPGVPRDGRVLDDLVSLLDLAPTFLDIAGAPGLPEATGQSLLPFLDPDATAHTLPARDAIFLGLERHTLCRAGDVGYPARAIRTRRHAYIRNYEADRWPAGDPDFFGLHFADADAGPTRTLMLAHKDDPDVSQSFSLAFDKRPREELYDLETDPDQLHNLAAQPESESVRAQLAARLDTYLEAMRDPRARGGTLGDDATYHWRHPRDRSAQSAAP